MQIEVVNINDLKKTPKERELERKLAELNNNQAIRVSLGPKDRSRSITRKIRLIAKNIGREVRIRHNEQELYITLKGLPS